MTLSVLVCGTSTRAIAESAAAAGFAVTAVDAFADLDQHPAVCALSAARDLSASPTAAAIARVAGPIERDALVYLAPFENHPQTISTLATRGALWGNTPETLRRVRNPFLVASVLSRHGFATPRLANDSNDPNDPNDPNDSNAWLRKPFRSGGGRRVRDWRGERIPPTTYRQERVAGVSGSLIFVSATGACAPLGFSRQLVGDANFGAGGYRYCGSILAPCSDPQFPHGLSLFPRVADIAQCIASEFGLVGMNNIDFIARDGIPYVVEVNPRWSSSVEVAERAFDAQYFGAHAQACAMGTLPSFDCAAALRETKAFGKAIVYARHSGVVGDTTAWLRDPSVRDVPRPGSRIRRGEPVCSVHATGTDSSVCYGRLVARAAAIYAELGSAVVSVR